MSQPLVTVICLTYNHGNMIEDALKGFVMQKTTFSFEVLVHDDASTDNTASIIRRFAEEYPEIIKPIYQTENRYSKHIGITNTYLLPRARGVYLAFCEGDDFWTDENKLQRQIDFLEQHNEYVACVHNSMQLDCTNNKTSVMFGRTEDCDITFEDTLYAWARTYQTSSLVMRREYREQQPEFFSVAKGYTDWPLGIWLALNGKIRFFNQCMSTYRYCSCPHSFMAKKRGKDPCALIKNTIDMLKAVRPYTAEDNSPVLEKAILKQEYQLLKYQYRFSEMRKAPYRQLYLDEPLKEKLKLYIKQFFPKLVGAYKKANGTNNQ